MARAVLDTTSGAGDTGKAGGDKLNAMTAELYAADAAAMGLISAAGGTMRALRLATLGTSHCTKVQGLGQALQYALMRYHDADLTWDWRSVFTSVSDPTIIANPGNCYATFQAGTTHFTAIQLPRWVTDAQANPFDIVITDFGLYNNAPANQADLDSCMTAALSACTTFFANGVKAVGVWGTFGLNPTLCRSWANMWRRQEQLSNGRIRFIDTASALIDPVNTSGTAWAWRGGNSSSVFGAYSLDNTHVSAAGARAAAMPLSQFLQAVCPRKFNFTTAFTNANYDSANLRWGDILGSGGAMIGTNGLDAAGGGTVTGTVPGSAGASGLNDRWYLSSTGSTTRSTTLGATGPAGEREMRLTLGGSSAADTYAFIYQATSASVNNGDATRRYMCGIELQLVGVTGLCEAFIQQGGTNQAYTADYTTPFGTGAQADGLPDTTSETWRLRSFFPTPLTGANPNFIFGLQLRSKNPISGEVRFRNGFAMEVV